MVNFCRNRGLQKEDLSFPNYFQRYEILIRSNGIIIHKQFIQPLNRGTHQELHQLLFDYMLVFCRGNKKSIRKQNKIIGCRAITRLSANMGKSRTFSARDAQ